MIRWKTGLGDSPPSLLYDRNHMRWSCKAELSRILRYDREKTLREHLRWLLRFYRWRRVSRLAVPLPQTSSGDVVAVLLNFRRPQNIDTIVRSLLHAPSIKKVILSNNNPRCVLHRWMRTHHPALHIIHQTEESSAMVRFRVLQDEPAPFYVCMDDDVFLSPDQIERLCAGLRADPSVPHGVFSSTWENGAMKSIAYNVEGGVAVISRVYAFTHRHLQEFHRLAGLIGMTTDPAIYKKSIGDDIVLSFSGVTRPQSHDVGLYLDCPTSGDRKIATWKRTGFFTRREQIYASLEAMTHRDATL